MCFSVAEVVLLMSSEMDGDVAVAVSDVTKTYRIFKRPQDRFLQALFRGRRTFFEEFHAVRNVDFTISRGEVVGILGRNGSGKSTLLQMIAGTLQPTSGEAKANGRLAALLELGAGFSPDFSGMDNARLSASILGLSDSEIERKLPEILAFADIGDHIFQPVKTYSSGMYVRLAFAVAACVDPDILIIDEALAVGDVKFQTKCFRRFEELVASGKTIIFVTHSVEQVVRHCTRALLIDGGGLIDDGVPREIANRYLDMMVGAAPPIKHASSAQQSRGSLLSAIETRAGYCSGEYRWGEGRARILDATLIREGEDSHCIQFDTRDRVQIQFAVEFDAPSEKPIFGVFVKTPDGVTVYGNSSRNLCPPSEGRRVVAGDIVSVTFSCLLNLGCGSYVLSLGVSEDSFGEIVPLDRRYDVMQFEIVNFSGAVGLSDLDASCQVVLM